MLTNLVEKGKIKCSQYWPEAGHQEYGNVDVTIVNTINQTDFVVCYFQIKHVIIKNYANRALKLQHYVLILCSIFNSLSRWALTN